MAAELIEAEAQLEELIIRLDSYKRDHRGALESLNSDLHGLADDLIGEISMQVTDEVLTGHLEEWLAVLRENIAATKPIITRGQKLSNLVRNTWNIQEFHTSTEEEETTTSGGSGGGLSSTSSMPPPQQLTRRVDRRKDEVQAQESQQGGNSYSSSYRPSSSPADSSSGDQEEFAGAQAEGENASSVPAAHEETGDAYEEEQEAVCNSSSTPLRSGVPGAVFPYAKRAPEAVDYGLNAVSNKRSRF